MLIELIADEPVTLGGMLMNQATGLAGRRTASMTIARNMRLLAGRPRDF